MFDLLFQNNSCMQNIKLATLKLSFKKYQSWLITSILLPLISNLVNFIFFILRKILTSERFRISWYILVILTKIVPMKEPLILMIGVIRKEIYLHAQMRCFIVPHFARTRLWFSTGWNLHWKTDTNSCCVLS